MEGRVSVTLRFVFQEGEPRDTVLGVSLFAFTKPFMFFLFFSCGFLGAVRHGMGMWIGMGMWTRKGASGVSVLLVISSWLIYGNEPRACR